MPRISRAAAEKRYEEVIDSLRSHIASSSRSGDFLPPERTLAAALGVSRSMLRQGIQKLLDSGELVTHRGIGTRIAIQARREHRADTRMIGLLLPDLGSPFFSDVTESIEYALMQHGYQLLLCNSRHQSALEERHILSLAEQKVAGVILAHDPYLPFPEAVSLFHDARIPYVALFNASSRANCDSVAVDEFSGVYQAMRYLISLGHKQIAFCRPVPGTSPHPREQAYAQFLEEADIPEMKASVLPLEALEEKRFGDELQSLLTGECSPTAFVAGNDQTALLLIKRLSALNRRVPEDISVIGFDNLDFTELLPKALTTVNQPKREMGRRAVELLLEHIELATPSTGRNEVFETYLIIRESCAVRNGRH